MPRFLTSIKETTRPVRYNSLRTMKRTVRVWIAAFLAALLAVPAMPAFGAATHGAGHSCCAVAAAPANAHGDGDCAGGASPHRTVPVCSDGGPSPTSSGCLHCALASAHASFAPGSTAVRIAIQTAPYVHAFPSSPFLPDTRVERLDRPPKAVSF